MSKKQFPSTPFWMIYDLMVNYMEIQDFVELPCISLLRYTWNDTGNVLENCETILEKVLEKCLNFFLENLYSPWIYCALILISLKCVRICAGLAWR